MGSEKHQSSCFLFVFYVTVHPTAFECPKCIHLDVHNSFWGTCVILMYITHSDVYVLFGCAALSLMCKLIWMSTWMYKTHSDVHNSHNLLECTLLILMCITHFDFLWPKFKSKLLSLRTLDCCYQCQCV